MISTIEYEPYHFKLVGGKFDGEVFWREERIEQTFRIDLKRMEWASIYMRKENDGEECEEGSHVLYFVEEMRFDELQRILREANPPLFLWIGEKVAGMMHPARKRPPKACGRRPGGGIV